MLLAHLCCGPRFLPLMWLRSQSWPQVVCPVDCSGHILPSRRQSDRLPQPSLYLKEERKLDPGLQRKAEAVGGAAEGEDFS